MVRPCGAMFAGGLLALAAGCGGGSEAGPGDAAAPVTDATVADFCEAHVGGTKSIVDDVDLADPDYGVLVDGYRAWADELERVGTPADAPDDARRGLEEAVAAIRDLTAADVEAYWTSEDEDAAPFSYTDDYLAFDTYAGETCTEGGSTGP